MKVRHFVNCNIDDTFTLTVEVVFSNKLESYPDMDVDAACMITRILKQAVEEAGKITPLAELECMEIENDVQICNVFDGDRYLGIMGPFEGCDPMLNGVVTLFNKRFTRRPVCTAVAKGWIGEDKERIADPGSGCKFKDLASQVFAYYNVNCEDDKDGEKSNYTTPFSG